MSLETTHTAVVYVGNGSNSEPYPITFAFLATGHIKVTVTDADDEETVLSPTVYAVTLYDSGLGQVVLQTAYDDTNTITISRVTPPTQPIVLQDGALIPAKTLEHGLDRLAMATQETRGQVVVAPVETHASTHAAGGEDPVTLAQSQITGLVNDLTAKASGADFSSHTGNTSNPHSVTKAQVGLGSADDTSDAEKPISNLTQAALDTKADALLADDVRTGTAETLVLGSAGKRVTMNNSSANTLTVPNNTDVAFANGTQVLVQQLGTGLTSIAAASGVTIHSRDSLLNLAGRYAVVVLIKDGTNVWTLTGDRA